MSSKKDAFMVTYSGNKSTLTLQVENIATLQLSDKATENRSIAADSNGGLMPTNGVSSFRLERS
jgi:hypothetical protein